MNAGNKAAGHMSAASAKEAIRAMEADKQERRDREAALAPAHMRSDSRDRDARPRERADRGR